MHGRDAQVEQRRLSVTQGDLPHRRRDSERVHSRHEEAHGHDALRKAVHVEAVHAVGIGHRLMRGSRDDHRRVAHRFIVQAVVHDPRECRMSFGRGGASRQLCRLLGKRGRIGGGAADLWITCALAGSAKTAAVMSENAKGASRRMRSRKGKGSRRVCHREGKIKRIQRPDRCRDPELQDSRSTVHAAGAIVRERAVPVVARKCRLRHISE